MTITERIIVMTITERRVTWRGLSCWPPITPTDDDTASGPNCGESGR